MSSALLKRIELLEEHIALESIEAIPYVRPYLYPKQLAAIFDDCRYSVIEASTKAGKTHGCVIWLAERAILGLPNVNHWWVAPVYTQAKMAYRRMKNYLKKGEFRSNDSELKITIISNGACMWFKTGEKPDNLYGEDVYSAVLDEASRMREESWYAIRSTLTFTKAPVRIIGNVKGRKNWAYKLGVLARSGNPDMGYHKLTAYDAVEGGILDAQEIDNAKALLPENVFKELYLAEPSEDGANPFGLMAISQCAGELSCAEPHVWGIDLAKSYDFTVAIAFDREGKVCRFERWQSPWEMTIERIKALVGLRPALVDSTGVGDPILESFQKIGTNYIGYKFSSGSKQKLMEGLAVGIQQQKMTYPKGIIVDELEIFEYEIARTGVKYSAPVGMHDDCVCALALAWSIYNKNCIGIIEYYRELSENLNNDQ
jgi:hypothetical protein